MHKKLAPHFIQITQDACLKAFWQKRALRTFLKQHYIKDQTLATWHEDETKADFLAGLFYQLVGQKENKGHAVILKMAESLSEMTHFPDLEKWEDSTEKIKSAKEAVRRLKAEVDKVNEQVEEEKTRSQRRKAADEQRQKNLSSVQSLEKLSGTLNELLPQLGTQPGGYAFEKWFYELVTFFDIPGRPPYHADGRQIDGSLTLDGTTYLVETKFTKEQTGSPDIDTFFRKVHTKAEYTMGIFLSMSGFTKGAIDSASCDRTPLILLDSTHIYNLILSGVMSLPEVIRRIRRHASQTGESFLAVDKFST